MLARVSPHLIPSLWLVAACAAACGDAGEEATSAPTTLATLAGPSGAVRYEQVVVTGSDCASGTYRSQISSSGRTASVTFDALSAVLRSSDPEDSAKYADRARCALSLRLAGEEGVAYALPAIHYAATSRPERVGSLEFETSWAGGARPQSTFAGLLGPLGGDHTLRDLQWSACTGTRELRIGLDLSHAKAIGTPWFEPEELISVSELSVPSLLVRRCDPASRPTAPSTASPLPIRRVSSPSCRVNSTISADGTAATVSFTDVMIQLASLSKYSSASGGCSLEVEVDAPEGQSFTLESSAVAGSATLPAGYAATVIRKIEGQAFATEDMLEAPFNEAFSFTDRYLPDSPFVGEHGGSAACGKGKIRMQISLRIERRGGGSGGDAQLRLGSLGPMRFVARPCSEP